MAVKTKTYFDHSSTIDGRTLAKITAGIASGESAKITAALRRLAVCYGVSPQTPANILLRLWESGPESGTPAPVDGAEVERIVQDAIRKANGLNEQEITSLIETIVTERFNPPKSEIIIKTPTSTTKVEGLRHYMFETILKRIAAGSNVYLTGQAGTGKTTIAEQIAKAVPNSEGGTGRDFYCTGAVSFKSELEGFINATGEYRETSLYKAFKYGGIFLFDEIDGCSANALLAFNAILANKVASFPCGVVKKHPDFACIAAANTYGRGADRRYSGRCPLDESSLDRFEQLPFDVDEDLERAIAQNDEWVEFVQGVRAAVERLKMDHLVSPRASIDGAQSIAAGVAREDTLDDRGNTIPGIERSRVWKGLNAADVDKIREEMESW
jgi:cobaltochelatase CobS